MVKKQIFTRLSRFTAFLKKRFWLVSFLCVLIILSVILVFFADTVMAKIYYANGYYTKVCGDYVSPNGDLNGNVFRPADACQNKCDLGAGTCSGNTVYRFECDGKTTDCRSNAQGPGSSQSLNRAGLCGKTIQIDVFRRNCLASGDCNNLPSYDENADLQDFIVWYAGDCSTPPPPPTAPTVDIKVNNLDGAININYNSAATLSWTSSNANSCSASNAWSGYKYTSGSESTGLLTFSKIYTITCIGTGGTASDSVTINVDAPLTPLVDLRVNSSDGPITLNYNSNANLSWNSSNAVLCQAGGDWSGSKGVSGSQSVQLNQVRTYIFTLACKDSTGAGTSTDSVTVNVTPNPPVVVTKPAIVTY